MIQCSKCGETNLALMARNRAKKSGYGNLCCRCKSEQDKRWRKRKREGLVIPYRKSGEPKLVSGDAAIIWDAFGFLAKPRTNNPARPEPARVQYSSTGTVRCACGRSIPNVPDHLAGVSNWACRECLRIDEREES